MSLRHRQSQTEVIPARPQPGTESSTRRRKRVGYVVNEFPEFAAPTHHKKRPNFIMKTKSIMAKRDVCSWQGWYVLRPGHGRKRNFNLHCRRALNAMMAGMVHYVNLATWQIENAVENLTKECQLDTTSVKGNRSISRGSRRIQLLEEYGLVECENVWDRERNTWVPKFVRVTNLFWDVIGVGAESACREREKRWAWVQEHELDPEQAGRLTLSEYCQLKKIRHRERSFEIRKNKQQSAAAVRRAKRIAALERDKQVSEISSWYFKTFSAEQAHYYMHHTAEFTLMVNTEINRLRALALESTPADSPPDDN